MQEWEKNLEKQNKAFEPVSHCEIVKEDVGDFFDSVATCFEHTVNERSTKLDVVGSLFGMGASLLKLGFNGTVCAIANTPKAVVAVADAKHQFVEDVTQEFSRIKQEDEERRLEEKIEQMKAKQLGYTKEEGQ